MSLFGDSKLPRPCPFLNELEVERFLQLRGAKWRSMVLSGEAFDFTVIPSDWLWFVDYAKAAQVWEEDTDLCDKLFSSALEKVTNAADRVFLLTDYLSYCRLFQRDPPGDLAREFFDRVLLLAPANNANLGLLLSATYILPLGSREEDCQLLLRKIHDWFFSGRCCLSAEGANLMSFIVAHAFLAEYISVHRSEFSFLYPSLKLTLDTMRLYYPLAGSQETVVPALAEPWMAEADELVTLYDQRYVRQPMPKIPEGISVTSDFFRALVGGMLRANSAASSYIRDFHYIQFLVHDTDCLGRKSFPQAVRELEDLLREFQGPRSFAPYGPEVLVEQAARIAAKSEGCRLTSGHLAESILSLRRC